MQKQSVTIRDIAKEAQTSTTTVSRFLNKSGYVDAETAKSIQDIISRHGYVPSRTAQSLKTKRTNQIMLVVPDICNPFYSTMAKTIQVAAKDKGYIVTLYNTNEDPSEEIHAIKVSEQIYADGIIIASVYVKDEVITALNNARIPKVVANSYENCPFDTVHGAVEEGTYLTAKHLIENGHKTIAFAGGPAESATEACRKSGYLKALKEYGLEANEDYIFEMGFSVDAGIKAGKYFSTFKSMPSAICCANDLIAFGVLTSFIELGISVPDDISLTGMDNIDFTNLSRPRLTTATNDSIEFGKNIINLLFDRIEGKYTGTPREILIPRVLIPRDSVKNIIL